MNNTKKEEQKQLAKQEVSVIKLDFAPETVDLIKRTIAVDATNDELNLFLYQAKRTGLDPLARQIYFVKRAGKVVIQTSIDGFRVVAERSKKYQGQTKPEWCDENGKWFEVWPKSSVPPTAARIGIYRSDFKEPLYAIAKWTSYVPQAGQDFMWRKMPDVMILKVAEALALRKTFPQDLSGIYTDEEMAQAENKPAIQAEPVREDELPINDDSTPSQGTIGVVNGHLVTDKQLTLIAILLAKKGFSDEQLYLKYNVNSKKDLTKAQASTIIENLQGLPDKEAEAEINYDEVDAEISKTR